VEYKIYGKNKAVKNKQRMEEAPNFYSVYYPSSGRHRQSIFRESMG